MNELLLREYQAALTERTAVNCIGRLIGTAIALVGLTMRDLAVEQAVALGVVAYINAFFWAVGRTTLTRHVHDLEMVLGRTTEREIEDEYIASRRYSEIGYGLSRIRIFEPQIWLLVGLMIAVLSTSSL